METPKALWTLCPIVDLSALPAGPAASAEEAAILDLPIPVSTRPPATVVELRKAWKAAIDEETKATEALRAACVDGQPAEWLVSLCYTAASKRETAFQRWAEAYVAGPDACYDGQPHRYRPLTTGERIGYQEMASERELDAARKCGECGAWSDTASVAREAQSPNRPLPGAPEYQEWVRNERGVPAGRVPRGWNSVIAALALACFLPLLPGPAHAAGAPRAPRQGRAVAGCVKQPSGKWAKQTPAGKLSTVACEPEITLRITDRANGMREGYEVRYTSPERCTVWVAEKRADDAKVIGAAYDACIDTMASRSGA